MKIVFDVTKASVVEPIFPAIDQVKDHLVHFHLSDTDGKRWTHSSIGEGTIDFRPIAEKLMEVYYSGVSILETTMPGNPKDSIISSVEKLSRLGWQL
jgi:sugar phosphate isomerase/epimerase